MAFIIKEENTPYGADVIESQDGVGTAGALIQAIERFNGMADEEDTPVLGVLDGRVKCFSKATQGPSGLVLEMSDPPRGMPVPASLFVTGLRHESGGDMAMRVFVKAEDEIRLLAAARLEEKSGGGRTVKAIALVAGDEADAGIKTARDASVAPPRNSEDLPRRFRELVRASGRPNLGKLPLFCVLATVPDQNLLAVADDDDTPDELREVFRQAAQEGGLPCVVDLVQRRQNHVEIHLMSVSVEDMSRMQTDAADVCADKIVRDFEALGPGLPLFFMYRGKPYAATEFSAEGGAAAKLTLEPWQDVLESADAQEISDGAAMFAADGLL